MSIENQLKQYKNKNIHIVGIGGAEGSAIAEFLVANGISSITGHDFSSKGDFKKAFNNTHLSLKPEEREEALDHLLNLPIKINFRDHYLEDVKEADIVFVSQVWFKYPQNMPILENIKDDGVPFKTITNLYFELMPGKIISVTGTNGKTTTSRLINNIFEDWKETCLEYTSLGDENDVSCIAFQVDKKDDILNVYFAGNDRQNLQVLDQLEKMKKEDILILETSSTQLLLNSCISPSIGVITNISPNHLDDHGSIENYIEAKKNLIRYQKKGDWAVLNYDNEQTRKIAKEFSDNAFLFSAKEELTQGCFVKGGEVVIRINEEEFVLFLVDDIKIPGNHNLENVLAAASCAYLYGINLEIIKKMISKYTGTKHRLKLLYNIDGIKYYDDTQATNPESTIAGINSFDNDIILLSGGDDKRMNYEELGQSINSRVKFLILFPGGASEKIESLVNKKKIDFVKVKNFQEAIDELKKYYQKTDLKKDGTVLISPGAAHFYSRFVENSGKDLKEWIRSINI
ncbi:MAG: UDP-N-acetylmuramoyl-L-alanine--D-glutamate ligase [Candidatus Pacebacteria bacterium]|nr:UDP-N-acetylmuramoyl-L-alanine--D-glutamate ligase [Candidatus Paceibacterota bacterium]